MADDTGKTPAPRPRRRRKDVDPSYQEPKVANERRRSKTSARASESGASTPRRCRSSRARPPSRPRRSTPRPIRRRRPMRPISPRSDTPLDAANDPTRPFSVPGARDADPAVATAAVAMVGATGETWLPMLEDRSPDPSICPFLRAVDGELVRSARRGARRRQSMRRAARSGAPVAAPTGTRLPDERARQLPSISARRRRGQRGATAGRPDRQGHDAGDLRIARPPHRGVRPVDRVRRLTRRDGPHRRGDRVAVGLGGGCGPVGVGARRSFADGRCDPGADSDARADPVGDAGSDPHTHTARPTRRRPRRRPPSRSRRRRATPCSRPARTPRSAGSTGSAAATTSTASPTTSASSWPASTR